MQQLIRRHPRMFSMVAVREAMIARMFAEKVIRDRLFEPVDFDAHPNQISVVELSILLLVE